jgi:hypothetical protein
MSCQATPHLDFSVPSRTKLLTSWLYPSFLPVRSAALIGTDIVEYAQAPHVKHVLRGMLPEHVKASRCQPDYLHPPAESCRSATLSSTIESPSELFYHVFLIIILDHRHDLYPMLSTIGQLCSADHYAHVIHLSLPSPAMLPLRLAR